MSVRRSSSKVLMASLLCALLAAGTLACSGKSGANGPKGSNPLSGTTVPPQPTSGGCDDPTGDLSVSSDKNGVGSLSEPAGIDIVRADAKITEKTLQVSIRTAGPIAAAPAPFFIVNSGPPLGDLSFELRLEPTGAAGSPWGLTVATFKNGVDDKKPRNAPVKVVDNFVNVEIPLSDIPPIVSLLWIFGSASGDGDNAISDECANLTNPATTHGSDSTAMPPRTTTPPTTSAPILFGTEQTYLTTGSKITVFDAQFPPKSPKRFDGTTIPFVEGFGGAVIDVQVCAGDKGTRVSAGYFQVKTTVNRLYPVWAIPQPLNEPAFPVSQEVVAGECLRGWITFELPSDSKIGAVYYSPDGSGRNFLIWKVT